MAIVSKGKQSKLQMLICLLVTLTMCNMRHTAKVTSRHINFCNLLCSPSKTIAIIYLFFEAVFKFCQGDKSHYVKGVMRCFGFIALAVTLKYGMGWTRWCSMAYPGLASMIYCTIITLGSQNVMHDSYKHCHKKFTAKNSMWQSINKFVCYPKMGLLTWKNPKVCFWWYSQPTVTRNWT